MIATFYAAQDAAKEGIEWLVGIDHNELIIVSRDEQVIENHIPRYPQEPHKQVRPGCRGGIVSSAHSLNQVSDNRKLPRTCAIIGCRLDRICALQNDQAIPR